HVFQQADQQVAIVGLDAGERLCTDLIANLPELRQRRLRLVLQIELASASVRRMLTTLDRAVGFHAIQDAYQAQRGYPGELRQLDLARACVARQIGQYLAFSQAHAQRLRLLLEQSRVEPPDVLYQKAEIAYAVHGIHLARD